MMKLAFRLFACLFLVTPLSVHAITIDATSFDPVPIEIVAMSSGGVPIGTVIIWPYAQNPLEGAWLECDGKIIPVEYDELIAIAGSQTPNYKGMFLRGHGEQVSNHYGIVTHKSDNLGVIQGDVIRNITASMYSGIGIYTPSTSGAFYGSGNSVNAAWVGGGTFNSLNFNAARIVPTATENRPINMAVRYLIKAQE